MTSRFTTNDMMETPSTYFDFSDTTVNPLYNTTDSLDDVSTDIEAVVGGVVGGVFLITVLLILVFVVLRRRKKQKCTNKKGNRGETTYLQIQPDNEQDHYTGDGVPNALHAACKNANLKMCEHLIQTHPDLLHSVDNDGGNTALQAAQGGNVNILQLLTDNEVDVKHKNNNGWNILNVACVNSNLEMSRYIIQTHPDLLHNVDNDGWNAALHAAYGGNVEILQLLADNEVDVKHKSNDDRNILHVACAHSNLEMSRYIIQTYPDLLHSVRNTGWNAALHAAQRGNVKILKVLADNGVDAKYHNKYNYNILHVACVHSNFEMSRYIIQTYPDLLHSVDKEGWNAALFAARGGNVKILQLLANNEVDVKHKENDGWNILNVTCGFSNVAMSRYITQTYPDLLHNVDNDGWNVALHDARGGNVKILKLLADNGVDVKHKDNHGLNILHVACVHSNLAMSHHIIQTYPDLLNSEDAALLAAREGNVKIIQLLANHGVKT
ncbi:ankyrin repeat domain-containing protein 50-like [Ostrea edulis]|uniref:ankyrin repeat domain-containing protein 50-like n=1 Tax=Ostrea edulis TaxID=37623 RepID=UPI0024AFA6F8|nr:ankyrin repeat domain-containing protein 50-like [Ostrea edulis]XP_055999102.1 ankyrin repeat domain-containing protein 50-like [Ostrea edulis]